MLEILFRDESLIAINKPSGLLVHRSGLATDRVTCMTLLRDLIGAWVYPVHRLDRGASGVLLFALDSEAAAAAAEAFARRTVRKEYLAIVRGWAPAHVEVDYPLDDDEEQGSARVEARTTLRSLACAEVPHAVGRYATARYSLVQAEPHTGRRHQIRRHLAHLRHPIIGDAVHGDGRHNRFFRETYGMHRLLLHGCRLRLAHPRHGRELEITAPLPEELATLCATLGWSETLTTLGLTEHKE
jgi:tRNA pseudouridine65 synthase